MRAKLSAQIDTGATCVDRTSAPAATSSPTIVSMSGRPAATRLPKAITRMTIVTGHDSISERSMAERLAELKLAHRALSPVRVTEIPGRESAASGLARASAARTMVFGSAAAPAVTTPVRPSRDSDTPAAGRTTVETRGSARSRRATLPAWPARPGRWRSAAVVDDDDLQGGRAEPGEVPLDDARAATDWLVESCQPAPARAFSTRGAKTPKTASTTNQRRTTARKCVAVQVPRRASGLPRWEALPSGSGRLPPDDTSGPLPPRPAAGSPASVVPVLDIGATRISFDCAGPLSAGVLGPAIYPRGYHRLTVAYGVGYRVHSGTSVRGRDQ